MSAQGLRRAICGGALLGLCVRLDFWIPTSFSTPEIAGSIPLCLGNLQVGPSFPILCLRAHSSRAVELKLTVSALNITQAPLNALASAT